MLYSSMAPQVKSSEPKWVGNLGKGSSTPSPGPAALSRAYLSFNTCAIARRTDADIQLRRRVFSYTKAAYRWVPIRPQAASQHW
jgi:hypothetical protein